MNFHFETKDAEKSVSLQELHKDKPLLLVLLRHIG